MYYKSDFSFKLKIGDSFPEYDFIGVISTSSCNKYQFSRQGENYKNCYRQGDFLVIVCKDHKLSPGQVYIELYEKMHSDIYPDNLRTVVSRVKITNLYLEDAPSLPQESDTGVLFYCTTKDNIDLIIQGLKDEFNSQIDSKNTQIDELTTQIDELSDELSSRIQDPFLVLGYSINDVFPDLQNHLDYSLSCVPDPDSSTINFQENNNIVFVPAFHLDNSLTNFTKSFYYCPALRYVGLFDTSSGTNFTNMFNNCSSLISVAKFDLSSATNCYGMFWSCYGLLSIPPFDLSSVTNCQYMFCNCYSLVSTPDLDLSSAAICANMFNACRSLKKVNLKLGTKVSFQQAFGGCKSLEAIPQLDYSLITVASGLFSGCSALTNAEINDAGNATSCSSMFYSCSSLKNAKINNLSSCSTCLSMFNNCNNLETIELSQTKSVSNFSQFIYSTNSMAIKSLKGLSFKAVTNISNFFYTGSEGIYDNLREFLIYDLGTSKASFATFFSYLPNWGENSDECPDARQSLIDTLLTYSYDRASNGLASSSIQLHANTLARLTDEEIAAISAKGYTLS